MDAGFTAEQDEIRRTLRELLHKRCGPEELRAAVDTPAGHDPALWTALAEQLGLPGLALPEAYGGVGCSATELALAAEETGRVLAPSPLLATAVLVAPLVLALGTDAQRADLLPRIASGALTAALAAPAAGLALTGDNRGDWAGGGRAGGVQARRAGAGWTLYGEVGPVPDGHSARLLLVAAHTGGFARSRTLLFLVAGDADGVVRTRHTALDATRPLGHLQLRDVEAELLGDDGGTDVPAALARTGDGAAAVLACEAVGAADRVLERTVEYVKQREQFGRAIGSFQAVKHRLADVYVQVQAARSAAYNAAWATAHGERVGGIALAQGVEALRSSAGEALQLHGGIGFTWEHDVQLYFKRAAGDELLFGPVHRLRAHAADAASLFTATEVPV
ncbi:alkylation response protein AidB-like acyl-CoA dehydrogenase [Streptomyces sp. TLI_55]|uniref:acyl-CoA dehydrogenase family protein n=1 Tax=Streptomyces sp. TLI_55 TaxID=1938861 RepID=UPI000BC48801|nr:acyl-CoA dehydrogenase family protein [Streptomyces sp. TLI_55]SNX61958.1 alkylation response protein AidB-like acyl-CoA dehydrogenase [Streptomyces sp. TLI_55]